MAYDPTRDIPRSDMLEDPRRFRQRPLVIIHDNDDLGRSPRFVPGSGVALGVILSSVLWGLAWWLLS